NNRRLQRIAVGGDYLAFGVQVEGAVAGVGHGAVRGEDLEEAPAVDGHIQRLVGGLQAAAAEVLLGANDTHPGTQLQAGGQLGILGGVGTRLTANLIEQVLELGTVFLETGGRDVGQVVGNGGQVHVLGGQTGLAYPQ